MTEQRVTIVLDRCDHSFGADDYAFGGKVVAIQFNDALDELTQVTEERDG